MRLRSLRLMLFLNDLSIFSYLEENTLLTWSDLVSADNPIIDLTFG